MAEIYASWEDGLAYPLVSDYSSIWHFREQLAKRSLAETNWQLNANGLIFRRGTLIEASTVDAAVKLPNGDAGEIAPQDPDAGCIKKNR